jgi:hypothetical protein
MAGIVIVLILGIILVQGCSTMAKIPGLKELVPKPEEEAQPQEKDLGVKAIAVMPVDIKTGSRDAARIIRENLVEELYFKGYSKVPVEMVDAALAELRKRDSGVTGGSVPPQVIGSMLGADAVLYTTLLEASTTYKYVYAPVVISAVFELRRATTGDVIWKYVSEAKERDYGVTKNSLELGTTKIFEDVIREAVKKAVTTLPDGPGIR